MISSTSTNSAPVPAAGSSLTAGGNTMAEETKQKEGTGITIAKIGSGLASALTGVWSWIDSKTARTKVADLKTASK